MSIFASIVALYQYLDQPEVIDGRYPPNREYVPIITDWELSHEKASQEAEQERQERHRSYIRPADNLPPLMTRAELDELAADPQKHFNHAFDYGGFD